MSSPEQQQLGAYLGGPKETAKSLRAKGNRKAALGVLRAGVGKKPPIGVRVKTRSPTSSQSSKYGSVQLGNVVFGEGGGGALGFVDPTTGMLRNPNNPSWVQAPVPSMSARMQNALKNTASSIIKRPFRRGRARRASMTRSIQSALSYDPAFGRKVRNLQANINKLDVELQAANSAGNQNTVSRKRRTINSKTNEIVELVNAESNRLHKIYKNLGINFNKTPKNKLKSEPGALRRMINRILGTAPKVSFTSSRGPSTRSLAGRAAANAHRAQARLPNYGGRPGTGSATLARAGVPRTGTPIPLGPAPPHPQ
jgi:hypothetical protein